MVTSITGNWESNVADGRSLCSVVSISAANYRYFAIHTVQIAAARPIMGFECFRLSQCGVCLTFLLGPAH